LLFMASNHSGTAQQYHRNFVACHATSACRLRVPCLDHCMRGQVWLRSKRAKVKCTSYICNALALNQRRAKSGVFAQCTLNCGVPNLKIGTWSSDCRTTLANTAAHYRRTHDPYAVQVLQSSAPCATRGAPRPDGISILRSSTAHTRHQRLHLLRNTHGIYNACFMYKDTALASRRHQQ
jgi:hypothetical protein